MTLDQLRDAIEQLNPVEREIITTQVKRMIGGRKEYGPWDNSKKDNPKEALEEMLDGMQYISAELIKIKAEGTRRGKDVVAACPPDQACVSSIRQ